MPYSHSSLVAIASGLSFAFLALVAQGTAPPQRAKPPEWSRDVLDAFFDDAREHLVGARPEANGANAMLAASGAGQAGQPADSEAPHGFAWSQLVSADTLTTEVKRISNLLANPLTTVGRFKSSGFQECRGLFTRLAVLFAVIADYDKDVRWQQAAPAMRDELVKAANNCKAPSDQSFQDAVHRKADLDGLLRGEPPTGDAKELDLWSNVADRALLMRWMEESLDKRLSPAMSNAKAFAKDAAAVQHEAQLLAINAELIARESYDYWDDEEFQKYANGLGQAAEDLSAAAESGNYDAARTAVGAATQSCSGCHEGYRG